MTLDAPAPARTADPMLPRPFRVIGTHLDTRDTVTLSLEPTSGPPLRHAAGQFTMLHAFGVGEVPISICGDPTRPGPLLHTIRDVGAVTHALVTAGRGTVIGVRGPFRTGWEVADGQALKAAGLLGRVIMLAGDAGGWAGGVIPTDQLHQLLADHPDLLASLNETVGEQVPAPLVCSRCGQTITGPPYFQPHDGPPHHLDGGCPTEGATSGEG